MHLDHRRLTHFLRVVEHGSINRAAAVSFISQAGLTKSIRSLEEQIGGELFERRPQGVRLTRLGETFLRHARLIDNQMDKTKEVLHAQLKGDKVELRIGVSMLWVLRDIMPDVLSLMVTDLRKPRITVVSAHQSWRMIEELRDGELDLVIATPSQLDDLSGIEARYFQSDRQGVVARVGHPLADAKPIDLVDLSPYGWIKAAPETYSWRYLASVFLAQGMAPPVPRMAIDSNVLTLDLIARTNLLGIASWNMASVDHADQVFMLDTPISRTRTSAILTRAGDLLPDIAHTLIAAVSERLGPPEYTAHRAAP